MIHPYSDLYLEDIQRTLGVVFDISLRQERIPPERFAELFAGSELAHRIESGRCNFVVGRSGQEHASDVLGREVRYGANPEGPGAEYWCGYVLAYAQWQWFRSFREILDAYPLERLMERYYPMHEASLASICDEIGTAACPENPLRRLRKAQRMSQEDLARLSGASLRSIRAYEQGTQDICRASGETLYGLSRVLGCPVEELMKGAPRGTL
jgi:DNA-binding XRE family transcriptional regulator